MITNFNKNYETGEVTKETSSSTTTYKYTYDKNKNIKEKIEYIDGNPVRKYNYSGYKKFKNTCK